MIDIEALLKNTPDLYGYNIKETRKSSAETFYVLGHKKETVRFTETTDISITVYVKCAQFIGDSRFKVYEDMSENEVKEKISSAVSRAKLVKNQAYVLPVGGKEEYILPSNLSEAPIEEMTDKIATAVYSATMFEHGDINALEVFVTKEEISVKTSTGIDKKQSKYKAMVEAIPTWTENGQSVELYEQINFSHFDPQKITS